MSTDTIEQLHSFEALFTTEIERQARLHVARAVAERVTRLTEALRAFGLEPAIGARFVEIWEDMEHGLLPPKVIAELVVNAHGGRLRQRFDVPVGAFHCPDKPECIFELCMLRAEARQELQGGGDGHVLERMRGLLAMIQTGRNDWSDCQ